jgi:phosphocarrier protein HPr
MLEARIRVTNALGLHARAAAQLVRLANTFGGEITITRTDNGNAANAKSILNVLNLAAARGVELVITADGDDESVAVEAIMALFANKFGEGS